MAQQKTDILIAYDVIFLLVIFFAGLLDFALAAMTSASRLMLALFVLGYAGTVCGRNTLNRRAARVKIS